MQTDEVLLIRVHDSANDGRARLSFHTSFENPAAPIRARARVSRFGHWCSTRQAPDEVPRDDRFKQPIEAAVPNPLVRRAQGRDAPNDH